MFVYIIHIHHSLYHKKNHALEDRLDFALLLDLLKSGPGGKRKIKRKREFKIRIYYISRQNSQLVFYARCDTAYRLRHRGSHNTTTRTTMNYKINIE
jgi:hypothetical protein